MRLLLGATSAALISASASSSCSTCARVSLRSAQASGAAASPAVPQCRDLQPLLDQTGPGRRSAGNIRQQVGSGVRHGRRVAGLSASHQERPAERHAGRYRSELPRMGVVPPSGRPWAPSSLQALMAHRPGESLTAGSTGLQRDGLPGVRRRRRLPGRRFVIIHLRRRGRVDIDAAAEDERGQEQAEYKKSHAQIVFPPGLFRQRSGWTGDGKRGVAWPWPRAVVFP
jgi:hypothetical protein